MIDITWVITAKHVIKVVHRAAPPVVRDVVIQLFLAKEFFRHAE